MLQYTFSFFCFLSSAAGSPINFLPVQLWIAMVDIITLGTRHAGSLLDKEPTLHQLEDYKTTFYISSHTRSPNTNHLYKLRKRLNAGDWGTSSSITVEAGPIFSSYRRIHRSEGWKCIALRKWPTIFYIHLGRFGGAIIQHISFRVGPSESRFLREDYPLVDNTLSIINPVIPELVNCDRYKQCGKVISSIDFRLKRVMRTLSFNALNSVTSQSARHCGDVHSALGSGQPEDHPRRLPLLRLQSHIYLSYNESISRSCPIV